jgi:cell division protein FtsW
MVFSATVGGAYPSMKYIFKQCLAAAIGLAAMRLLMFVDYRQFRQTKTVFCVLGFSVILLGLALLGGQTASTRRFIRIGEASLQPSEFAKLALILFLAFYLERRGERMTDWRTLVGGGLILAVVCGLVLGGRDLGTVIAVLMITGVVWWVAGLKARFFALAAGLVVPLLAWAVWLEPYRLKRILIFLNPEADPLNAGFQILQSEIAVGTGGLLGQGLMQGKQKMFFLPEAHTDFIFAVICEEWGLIGALLVVIAFGVILWRGLLAAQRAPDAFGRYLATGITAMIVCQAMINLGVVLALLPTKGMPLPFISYGGTAMMTFLAASGVLLNVSQHDS